MNKRFLALSGAAALAIAAVAAAGVATSATAQATKPPVILVVDQQTLLTQSAAGKTVPSQVQSIKGNIERELKAEADKLKKEIDDFQKNGSLMSEEVRAKTERELAMRQQYALPQQAQIMEQAFGAVVQNANTKILVEAQPILKSIVDKRGATLLIDKSVVMYSAPETDVTAEVIAELDKKLKTVAVEKITLADVMRRLKEAQTAQSQQAQKKK
jgi:outer membrane protein